MNKLPIVLVCDKNFIMPTAVTITSILENRGKDTFPDIYVLGGDLDEEVMTAFKPFEKYDNCSVTVRKCSLEKYNEIVQLSSISPACLLKFDVSDILNQYDKVLYVDSDMIIREDLWDMYNGTDLGDNYFGAVLHSACILDGTERINGGFILFNAKKMRDDNMSEKLLAYRKSLGNRKSMDQQTFNEYCAGKITFLSSRYNCILFRLLEEQRPQFYTMDEYNAFYGTNYRTWKDAVRDAAVYHYITGDKPWKSYDIYAGDEWYKYYMKSPFKDVPLKRTGKIARLKRIKASEGMGGVIEHYIKMPLRCLYYSMRSLEFRKRKWMGNSWG